jgi:hypothetical protein
MDEKCGRVRCMGAVCADAWPAKVGPNTVHWFWTSTVGSQPCAVYMP